MTTHEGLISALEALGRFSRQQGDYSSSIAFYSKALQLAVKPETQATLRNTLGILEWINGAYPAALQHHQLALEIFQRTGDEVHGFDVEQYWSYAKEAGRSGTSSICIEASCGSESQNQRGTAGRP